MINKIILTIEFLHNWENYRLSNRLGLAADLHSHIQDYLRGLCQKHFKEGLSPRELCEQAVKEYPDYLEFAGF